MLWWRGGLAGMEYQSLEVLCRQPEGGCQSAGGRVFNATQNTYMENDSSSTSETGEMVSTGISASGSIELGSLLGLRAGWIQEKIPCLLSS